MQVIINSIAFVKNKYKHMKRIVTLFVGCTICFCAVAQNFNPNNLVVFRAGDGTASIATNIAAPIFLDEFTSTGTLVNSVALPTITNGSNKRILTSGTSTSEGQITRSVNGLYIFAVGYDAALGTSGTHASSLSSSATATTNRIIARLDNTKDINTTTAIADITSGNARSCISDDGTNIWCVGGGGGVVYNTIGSTSPSVAVFNSVSNLRTINIINNQLFIGTASGSTRLAAIGTGLPTTSGQTATLFNGITSTTLVSPYQFTLLDLDATVDGPDVLYVTDDGTGTNPTPGIHKFSLVGGAWVSNGVVDATTGYRGLAGEAVGGTVNLYAVKSANTLYALTDASGYNGSFTATPTAIATAPTGTAFRGVCFAPSATALPLNLLSFNGIQSASQINLWWSTNNEINTAAFEIQQSTNSIDFNTIATLVSKNTLQLNSYQYSTTSKGGTSYYRLKMIDKDGQFTYSAIVKVEAPNKAGAVSIYPNPATSTITINHPKATHQSAIRIVNNSGKVVISKNGLVNATSTVINVSTLSVGRYLVQFVNADGQVQSSQFIKN